MSENTAVTSLVARLRNLGDDWDLINEAADRINSNEMWRTTVNGCIVNFLKGDCNEEVLARMLNLPVQEFENRKCLLVEITDLRDGMADLQARYENQLAAKAAIRVFSDEKDDEIVKLRRELEAAQSQLKYADAQIGIRDAEIADLRNAIRTAESADMQKHLDVARGHAYDYVCSRLGIENDIIGYVDNLRARHQQTSQALIDALNGIMAYVESTNPTHRGRAEFQGARDLIKIIRETR